ncbi:hypothetical protein D3C83_27290 [compost metagenome]
MPERAVHRLVRDHELGLRKAELRDVGRIEVDHARVRRDGFAPARVGGLQRQVQRQRPEERLIEDESCARRAKFQIN